MHSKARILFMGTPDFAVPSLENLLQNGYPVIGVVTQPDRPKGRGRQPAAPPVKQSAEKSGLTVLQPERVRSDAFLDIFRTMVPDLVVVAAFGQILPREILDTPPLGCINVHPSLLPRHRGAAPMNWTLIHGDAWTGVTIMFMNEGVDTGDMLLQEKTPVAPEETYDHLHDRLAGLGADLLLRTVHQIETGTAVRTPQEDHLATYAPRLKKEDGLIRWQDKAFPITRLIRGLSATPGAYTFLEGKMLKVFMAVAEETPVADGAGTIGPLTDRGLPVAAGDGYVYLRDIQLEGKKRMSIKDFTRGYRLAAGTRLG